MAFNDDLHVDDFDFANEQGLTFSQHIVWNTKH